MDTLTRRNALTLAAAAGAGPAMAAAPPAKGGAAEDDFRRAFAALEAALGRGDLDAFYATIDDGAVIFDEDIPFRLTKADFKDHIDFHLAGLWESFAWKSRHTQFRTFGGTGIVAGAAVFRGKPRDSGYRQRHIAFTQGWARRKEGWRLINWHQSPFDGHIIEGSPG
jgi:ketosteroid isomerase-like protein